MKTVLQIISDTNIGGGGRSLINYLRYQNREEYRSEVVLPRGSALKERIEALGVTVHEIDAMADRSMDKAAIAPLRAIIRQVRPDLIHTHGSMSGRIAAKLCGKKVVYTRHCAFPPSPRATSLPGRAAGRLADALLSDGTLAISHVVREQLIATGVPEKKIAVLYNGVEPLAPPTGEERQALRRSYGFGEEDFVLGMLARVEPYKGQGVLLEAAGLLLERGRRVKVLIAGDGTDLPAMREKAKTLPEGTVVFTGFLDQVEKALWAMDLQVNASTESETSCLSLLEGMSMGLPAVVSDVGGNPMLIPHGENGLVVKRSDPAALAAAVEELMDDPQRLEAMSRRAVEVFRERFTGEIYAKNMEQVYTHILKGASHGTK